MSDHAPPKRSLAADASWLLFAKTFGFGITFVLPLLLVRQLSQEDFGVYRQLFLLVNTAIAMLPFGFVMSAYYFLPRVANRAAVAVNILFVYAVLAALAGGILFFQPTVLGAIFDNAELVIYSRLVAAVLFFTVVSAFVDLLALANGDVKGAATFVVATNVVKTAMLAVAAIVFASVHAILIASMVHAVLQLLFLLVYMKRGFGSFVWRVDFALLKQQLVYAVPLGLAAWLYWAQMESHHYFVARAFGPVTYAIYSIGCVVLPLTFMFGESMAGVLIHRVSELHSQNRRDDIVVLLSEASRNLAAVYLPLYALLMVTGRDLLAVVYTPKFIASWPIFAISLTLLPLGILSVISDAVVRSYSECRRFLVAVRVLLVALLLVALWLLTPRWGPIAAVSIMVGVNVIERLILTAQVARVLQLNWRDVARLKGIVGIAVTALAAAAAAFIARSALPNLGHSSALIISVIVFSAVYVGASFLLARTGRGGGVAAWQLAILRQPMRDVIATLWSRVRRTLGAYEAGEEAA